MARPRRHLRWGIPRRAPRAQFARVQPPADADTSRPLYQSCAAAMRRAVRLQREGYTIVAVTAVAGERVLAWRDAP